MKKSKVKLVPVDRLELNEGQLEWLPRNPRTWSSDDIDRMVRSIEKDPDFAEDRPVLAVQADGGALIVFAHNLLTHASKKKGAKSLPAVIYEPENDEDKETIRRRALLDNGSLGEWDTEILANEWDFTPEELIDYGCPDWTGIKVSGGDGTAPAAKGATEPIPTKTAKEDEDFDPDKGIMVRCKPGDIWELGDHRLMCGDSTDLETVRALMGGGRIS